MGVGPNRAGELVNLNNKCAKCGYLMPLPQSAGKHCPKCGTCCPKGGSVPLVVPPKTKVCFFCWQEVPKDALFCSRCGSGLSSKVDAIMKKGSNKTRTNR